MNKPIAVVAGASGLTGSALVSRLTAQGFRVRAFVRSPEALIGRWPGVDLQVGDLADGVALEGLCRGAQFVFNAAGHVDDWGRRELFWRVNCEGAERLARAAHAARVRRLVHLSTVDVFGFGARHATIDEDSPRVGERHPYSESKLEGERRVWAVSKQGLDVSVIYPTWIFGPGDRHFMPEIMKALASGSMANIDSGRPHLEMTFSENLADACILVAQDDRSVGQGYIVGDGYGLNLGGFLEAVARQSGAAPPTRSVPYGVALGLGAVVEGAYRLLARQQRPPITSYAIKTLANGGRYSLRKLRSLGFTPRVAFPDALRRSLDSASESPLVNELFADATQAGQQATGAVAH